MIPRTRVPAGLRGLAELQAGVVSREQVLGFGLTDRVLDRLLGDQEWRRVTPGVYALSQGSWLQLAWAGVLLGGAPAVLGGEAAAHLHGIQREPRGPITVFVGSAGRVTRDDRWEFVRSDRTGIGEPPRTRLPQTVVDLARSMSPDSITGLLAEVVGSRRATPSDILRVAEQSERLPHRRLLTDLLGDVADGVRSPLELRYLRTVERPHQLPRASRQESPGGHFATDAWYRPYNLLVELDGDPYHRGLAKSVDMVRDNEHRLAGITTLRFSWVHIVGDPCGVADQVASALAMNGWIGTPQACPRCARRMFHR